MNTPADYYIDRLPASRAEDAARLDLEVFGIDAWPPAVYESELASARSQYFGAFEPAPAHRSVPRLVGVVGLGLGIEAEILTIAVWPSQQKAGIGSALLRHAIDQAWESGAEEIFLEVRASHPHVQAWYAGHGFVPVGYRKNYYRDDDAVVMCLTRSAK